MSDIEEKPPFFKSWNRLYLFVIGVMAALILFFSLITAYYS